MSDRPALEVLAPPTLAGTVVAPDDDAALLDLFDDPAPNPATGAHVRAVMLSSLDGAATGPGHRSGELGDGADRRVFAALRALADVVLVGAGTVRAEGYEDVQAPSHLRAYRADRGRAERVELAVVTSSGAIADSVLDGGALVVAAAGAPGLGALRERVGLDRLVLAEGQGPGRVDPAAAVRALAARGLTRVHAEGGPRLLAGLATAGAVDELSVTLAARLIGGGATRILDSPVWIDSHLELAHLLRSGSTLLGRWLVA